jgi:glycosyltransferase involved in cell wall biosynthesis
MRVKNEERYLDDALRSVCYLPGKPGEFSGNPVFVLDDGSTDRTPEICSQWGIYYERQDDMPMDEGRDRTMLYRWALEYEPDWIFTLDGDEVLAQPDRLLAAAALAPDDVNVFGMWLAVMASPVEGPHKWYGPMQPEGAWFMDRMFRVRDADSDHIFESNFGNNLHCGCVPLMHNRKRELLNAWIRYYGYESPDAVERKRAFYSTHDVNNFPRVNDLWERRRKLRAVPWSDSADCREMGIHRTVIY